MFFGQNINHPLIYYDVFIYLLAFQYIKSNFMYLRVLEIISTFNLFL